MLTRALLSVWNHGRRVVEEGVRQAKVNVKPTAKLGKKQQLFKDKNQLLISDTQSLFSHRSWVQNIVGKSVQNLATNIRNANRFQSGSFSIFSRSFGQRSLNPRIPYFAFVGVGLAVSTQFQKEEQFGFQDKELVKEIQNVAIKSRKFQERDTVELEDGLPVEDLCDHGVDNYEFGEMISKGCNAAVYEAQPEVVKSKQELGMERKSEEDKLAIKVMFNLFYESNHSAIVRGMEKEILPAKQICDTSQQFLGMFGKFPRKKKRLKPHPSIIDIRQVFVDDMKAFDRSETEYPDSLPPSLCSWGIGRNKTMYIVMKRYDCTLREYMQWSQPLERRQSLMLFTQLLEGILHLMQSGIAHRDLKSDNILLDTSLDIPQLVICDFGCCVDGLQIPYNTDEVCKEGNPALMAPEISMAYPGEDSWLNYTKSDLWAAGTLAYEIFGSDNPFYAKGWDVYRTTSENYVESELPDIEGEDNQCINNLVKAILRRDPEQRPDPLVVANSLQLLLWSPLEWINQSNNTPLTGQEMTNWLLNMITQYVLSPNINSVEQKLKGLFLSRLDLDLIMESFRFLWSLDIID